MEAKVNIKHSKGIVELTFKEAQDLLNNNSKDFEVADKDKYRFDKSKGELIKLPKKKTKSKDTDK